MDRELEERYRPCHLRFLDILKEINAVQATMPCSPPNIPRSDVIEGPSLVCVEENDMAIIVDPVRSDMPERIRYVEYENGEYKCGPYRGEMLEIPGTNKALLRPGQLQNRPRISLTEQLSNIKALYEDPNKFDFPLLPPFSWYQVLAIQAESGTRLPPLIREYMLTISRQEAMSEYRYSFSQMQLFNRKEHYRLYDWGNEAIEASNEAADKDFVIFEFYQLWDEENRVNKLFLEGAEKGFIFTTFHLPDLEQYKAFRGLPPLCWMTTYEAMMDPKHESDFASHRYVAEEDAKADWTVKDMVEKLDGNIHIPESLKNYKVGAEYPDHHMEVFLKLEMQTKSLIQKHLVPAAVKIQRQYRLWRWRMLNIFNPHTKFGHYNLMIKARTAVKYG